MSETPDVKPTCEKCGSILLNVLKPGKAWFVKPEGKGRGLLKVGPKGAHQCETCGKVQGDTEFTEMNRAQIRAAEARHRKGR